MDITKKVIYFCGLLAVLLLAPAFLRSVEVTNKGAAAVQGKKPVPSVLRPNTPSAKPASASANDGASVRGRAKELRPEISVPPSASAIQGAPAAGLDKKSFEKMITGLEKVAAVAAANPAPAKNAAGTKTGLENLPTQARRPADAAKKVRWAPPPAGFLTAETFNYLIYRQEHPVTPTIRTTLDTIHGNLMLDLTPFTILIKPSKILVMIFGGKDAYSSFTKLPPWSGAASDLQSDTMYVVEGKTFYPLSVHELTHLYFDGYFLPTISPLWLSEGMAVYMQVNTTKQRPAWLERSLKRIAQGDIIPLEKMTVTEDLSSYSTAQAELWYTQAYSLVDYLLTKRTRDEFYKFCNELKSKTPLHQALYRAYGLPFTKVSVLENVWLHDLQKSYKAGKTQSPAPAAGGANRPASRTANQARPAGGSQPQKTLVKKVTVVTTY